MKVKVYDEKGAARIVFTMETAEDRSEMEVLMKVVRDNPVIDAIADFTPMVNGPSVVLSLEK